MSAVFKISTERSKHRRRVQTLAASRCKRLFAELRAKLDEAEAFLDGEEGLSDARGALVCAAEKLASLQQTVASRSVETEAPLAHQFFKLSLAHCAVRDWRPSIIYCDPPWAYSNPGHVVGTRSYYDTMSDAALARMPVPALAAEDCVMLMWATLPKLESAQRLMAAWGFEYKTVFCVWVKLEKYLGRLAQTYGSYTSPNAEFVLLGMRGNMRTSLRKTFRRPNVLMSRPMDHSRKPELLRSMAVDLFGDLPRIELFGRSASPDWVVWGNESTTEHQIDSKPESERLAAQPTRKKNDMRGGAEQNQIARLAAERRKKVASRGVTPVHGKKPAPLSDVLERYEPATIMGKREYRLLHDFADHQDTDIGEARAKRARFVATLEMDRDTPPIYESISRQDLAHGQTFLTPGQRRNTTYPDLTEEEIKTHLPIIQCKQRRNADLLFAFNHNSKNLPIVHDEPAPEE